MKLSDLATQLDARIVCRNPQNAGQVVDGVAPLALAQAHQVSFLSNPRYKAEAALSQAAAVIVSESDAQVLMQDAQANPNAVYLICKNPYLKFAQAAQLFSPVALKPAGIASSAVIEAGAQIDPSASIGAHVWIGAGALIGAQTSIAAGAKIGARAQIGSHSCIAANVVVEHDCVVGARCIVHAGVVIGADGFGFAPNEGTWFKIPQTGRVVIGDDVEIGANTTIDRGALGDTVIEEGVKLDNQIQIAHNCHIGAHTAIAACVGIAGSSSVGKHCQIGGGAGISGHLKIADHVVVGAFTAVIHNLNEAGIYTGMYPLSEHSEWQKNAPVLRHLRELRNTVKTLERTLKELEEKIHDGKFEGKRDGKL